MKQPDAYIVCIWHNDSVNGTHNSIRATGRTAELAEAMFMRQCVEGRPWRQRCFGPQNRVIVSGPNGFRKELKFDAVGEANA
jgi:hypothetical protein